MTWDLIVVGGANTDFVARAAALPVPGQSTNGDAFLEGPGGKGANQAVAASRLGARVALIAAVGADGRGAALLEQLAAERVDVSEVHARADAATGVAVIHVDARGEKQIIAALGANRLLGPDDVAASCRRLGTATVVLAQLEVSPDAVKAAFRWARAQGSKTVLDPAPETPLADDLLALADVVKPNAREAEALTGIQVTDRATAHRAAQQLLERGAGAVAIQAGGDGNLLVWRDGEHWLPLVPVAAVDATGAGDAFAATLAVWIARGRPLIEAATFANLAAAFATTRLGAQAALATEAELREVARRTNR